MLEFLIFSSSNINAWNDRPCRADYPLDDGLDLQQKKTAAKIFQRCPNLKTIAFTGIPEADDPVGRFPKRVWSRVCVGGSPEKAEARMSTRSALKWKLSEDWDARDPQADT